MPRRKKCRKVCQMPATQEFRPVGSAPRGGAVILSVDEYEAIRLIDKQGFSQEECSRYMQVARTTVQAIYNSARKKLAEALVAGLPLRIEGGDYQLCDGKEEYCGCGGCQKHRRRQMPGMQSIREEKPMRIAVPLDENQEDVCAVLSRAPWFLFWDEGKETIAQNPAAAAQSGAGVQAAQFLVDSGVNALITPRCGQNAAEVFAVAGIKIYKAAHKTAAENLAALESRALEELTHFHGGYHGIQ